MFSEQKSEIRDSENDQYDKRIINFFGITDYNFLGAHTERNIGVIFIKVCFYQMQVLSN